MSHPRPELEYVLDDTAPVAVIAHPALVDRLKPSAVDRGLRFGLTTDALEHPSGELPAVATSRRAMILYTSGTTGKPKGVVTTHDNITAQITSLIQAWEWTADDRILEFLPLHHIHGIVNVISCALWAGAVCEIIPEFDARKVWDRIAQGGLTMFMAVPTIYTKLIDAWQKSSPEDQKRMTEGCRRMRVMISGSAALPVSTLEKWQGISGHVLLEEVRDDGDRHGNIKPARMESDTPAVWGRRCPVWRRGWWMNRVRRLHPGSRERSRYAEESFFLEYWGRPEDTKKAFRNGWFMTGDVAVVENGIYRILGRSSVDIIKTGGEKVSALEIEEVLLTHPDIQECAVVGVPDPVWGEKVCAAVVLDAGKTLAIETLRAWGKERLAPYKVPKELVVLDKLPRNAMGKLVKPAVKRCFKAPEHRAAPVPCVRLTERKGVGSFTIRSEGVTGCLEQARTATILG